MAQTDSSPSPTTSAYGNVGGNLSPPPPAPADCQEAPVQVQQPFSAPTSPGSPAARPHCLSPAPVPSTSEPNWQATRAGLRERNAAMFNNELMADVHFVTGPPGEGARTRGEFTGRIYRTGG